MPIDKPLFDRVHASLQAVSTINFVPTPAETTQAQIHPLEDKSSPYVRAVTWGGCSNFRRAQRAKREGRDIDAFYQRCRGTAKVLLAAPAAPFSVCFGTCGACDDAERGGWHGVSKRSATGLREDAFAKRLAGLSQRIASLSSKQRSRVAAGEATPRDLLDLCDTIAAAIARVRLDVQACGVPRLRVSPFIAQSLADVDRAKAQLEAFVQLYCERLRQLQRLDPNLVDPQLFALGRDAQAELAEAATAVPTHAQQAGAPNGHLMVALQNSEGANIAEVLVDPAVLCDQSAYFRALLTGSLAQQAGTQVVVQTCFGATAKAALEALSGGKAPTIDADNLVAMYVLFDMWDCSEQLAACRRAMGKIIEQVGLDTLMAQAERAPGCELAADMLDVAWHTFQPVRAEHLALCARDVGQYIQATDRKSQRGHVYYFDDDQSRLIKNSRCAGEIWLKPVSQHAADAAFTLSWRSQEAVSHFARTPPFCVNGVTMEVHLMRKSGDARDLYTLALHVISAPTHEQNYKGFTFNPRSGRFDPTQSITVAGTINGGPLAKVFELKRRMEDDALSPHCQVSVNLCGLSRYAATASAQAPIFDKTRLKVELDLSIAGFSKAIAAEGPETEPTP